VVEQALAHALPDRVEAAYATVTSEPDAVLWVLCRRVLNDERPHGSLRNLTLRAFAEQAQQARKDA
jgi:hypothetical protein